MISIAIIGGSGYTGKYLIKYCSQHPNIQDFDVYANKSANMTIHEIFPDLVGEVENKSIISIDELQVNYDVYLVALPHGESLKYIPTMIENGKIVIDLGADFRLDDPEIFKKTYQLEHSNPQLLKNKDYGLAELNSYYTHNLISNPGCYPTAALLSIIPLLNEIKASTDSISTVAYSGLSGAGKKVSQSLLFSENYNTVKAYNVGNHRHEIEIIQEINKYAEDIDFSLTTHLLPVFSGIYSTTIINLKNNIPQIEADEILENQFQNSPFVRIRKSPPELRWVIGTNYFDMNVKSANKKIIVTAAIDNLIKGASGQAIQNLNIVFGWDETLGIKNRKEEFQNA
jgi:N-acetyl-gamma-glutamyl-phosphate reductase